MPGNAVDIEPVSGRILLNSGISQIASGDFQPATALKTEICLAETIIEFKKSRIGGLPRRNSLSIRRDWTGWLAQQRSWPPALPVFPANREFYREFCKIAALGTAETANNDAATGPLTQIPCATKQGIILAEQGILAREQGIFIGRN